MNFDLKIQFMNHLISPLEQFQIFKNINTYIDLTNFKFAQNYLNVYNLDNFFQFMDESKYTNNTLNIIFYYFKDFYFNFKLTTEFSYFKILSSSFSVFEILNTIFLIKSFCFDNISVIFFILLFFFVVLINTVKKKQYIFKPTYNQLFFENLVGFAQNILIENLGVKRFYNFLELFFLLFLFLLFANLFGMFPYAFTITSHISLTFTIAFIFFMGINIIGLNLNGLKFFRLFFPSGAPLLLAPFLVIIEIISYIARVFSLSIRLFANIMSGHTLLKILSSFGWMPVLNFGFSNLFIIFPFIVLLVITSLELVIAFLQAYVFVVLIAIYLNDVLVPH